MTSVEALQQQLQQLSPRELAELRDRFFEFEWEAWDRQFERDVHSAKLDQLAKKALEDHAARKTTPL
jgi:hypothetical protein